MNTLIVLVLIAIAVAVVAYLFNVLPDMGGSEKGSCNSEDYEIADKIASKRN